MEGKGKARKIHRSLPLKKNTGEIWKAKLDFLYELPFMLPFRGGRMERIASLFEESSPVQGSVLFKEGDKPAGVYLVWTGRLRLERRVNKNHLDQYLSGEVPDASANTPPKQSSIELMVLPRSKTQEVHAYVTTGGILGAASLFRKERMPYRCRVLSDRARLLFLRSHHFYRFFTENAIPRKRFKAVVEIANKEPAWKLPVKPSNVTKEMKYNSQIEIFKDGLMTTKDINITFYNRHNQLWKWKTRPDPLLPPHSPNSRGLLSPAASQGSSLPWIDSPSQTQISEQPESNIPESRLISRPVLSRNYSSRSSRSIRQVIKQPKVKITPKQRADQTDTDHPEPDTDEALTPQTTFRQWAEIPPASTSPSEDGKSRTQQFLHRQLSSGDIDLSRTASNVSDLSRSHASSLKRSRPLSANTRLTGRTQDETAGSPVHFQNEALEPPIIYSTPITARDPLRKVSRPQSAPANVRRGSVSLNAEEASRLAHARPLTADGIPGDELRDTPIRSADHLEHQPNALDPRMGSSFRIKQLIPPSASQAERESNLAGRQVYQGPVLAERNYSSHPSSAKGRLSNLHVSALGYDSRNGFERLRAQSSPENFQHNRRRSRSHSLQSPCVPLDAHPDVIKIPTRPPTPQRQSSEKVILSPKQKVDRPSFKVKIVRRLSNGEEVENQCTPIGYTEYGAIGWPEPERSGKEALSVVTADARMLQNLQPTGPSGKEALSVVTADSHVPTTRRTYERAWLIKGADGTAAVPSDQDKEKKEKPKNGYKRRSKESSHSSDQNAPLWQQNSARAAAQDPYEIMWKVKPDVAAQQYYADRRNYKHESVQSHRKHVNARRSSTQAAEPNGEQGLEGDNLSTTAFVDEKIKASITTGDVKSYERFLSVDELEGLTVGETNDQDIDAEPGRPQFNRLGSFRTAYPSLSFVKWADLGKDDGSQYDFEAALEEFEKQRKDGLNHQTTPRDLLVERGLADRAESSPFFTNADELATSYIDMEKEKIRAQSSDQDNSIEKAGHNLAVAGAHAASLCSQDSAGTDEHDEDAMDAHQLWNFIESTSSVELKSPLRVTGKAKERPRTEPQASRHPRKAQMMKQSITSHAPKLIDPYTSPVPPPSQFMPLHIRQKYTLKSKKKYTNSCSVTGYLEDKIKFGRKGFLEDEYG